MKINVHDILPEKSRHIVLKGTEPFLKEILARLTADDGDHSDRSHDSIRADLELSRKGKTVFVEGEAYASIHPPCARCLKTVAVELEPQIDVSLLPAPKEEEDAPEEAEMDEEAADESTYKNDEIDVGAILNEQLLLERPFRVLCTEDCKGLCATCGINLNEGLCGCAPQPKSLAFAELKNFKPEN